MISLPPSWGRKSRWCSAIGEPVTPELSFPRLGVLYRGSRWAAVARSGQSVAVPELDHLGLAVRNPARSLRFYRDAIGVDGVVREEEYGFVITTTKGVSFTLFKGLPPADHGEFHVGVSLPDSDAVRARREELRSFGVPEIEWWDEPGYVSVKVRDPDGYIVEMAWDEKHSGA